METPPCESYLVYKAYDRTMMWVGGFAVTLSADDSLGELFQDARGSRRFFLEQVPSLGPDSKIAILWYLGIVRNQQRKGHGVRLMNDVLALMKRSGQNFAFLEVDPRMMWCSDEFERRELAWRSAMYEKSGWVVLDQHDTNMGHHRHFMYLALSSHHSGASEYLVVEPSDCDVHDIENCCDPFEIEDENGPSE